MAKYPDISNHGYDAERSSQFIGEGDYREERRMNNSNENKSNQSNKFQML